MNLVVLKGNLTRDPEIKEVNVGSDKTATVANFTIASSRFYKKNNGESAKTTTFVDCEAWDSGAKTIGDKMVKGDPILVQGSLKTDNWEKDGQKFSKLRVRVERFDKLARFVATPETQKPEVVAISDGDDIDF